MKLFPRSSYLTAATLAVLLLPGCFADDDELYEVKTAEILGTWQMLSQEGNVTTRETGHRGSTKALVMTNAEAFSPKAFIDFRADGTFEQRGLTEFTVSQRINGVVQEAELQMVKIRDFGDFSVSSGFLYGPGLAAAPIANKLGNVKGRSQLFLEGDELSMTYTSEIEVGQPLDVEPVRVSMLTVYRRM